MWKRGIRLAGLSALLGVCTMTLYAGPGPAKVTPQESPIPQSVFEIPKAAKDGRDPFYPNSSHPFGATAGSGTKTTNAPPAAALVLKALSGTPANRLATINNVTFAAGEEAEVISGAARVRVRVLEIKEDSVEVEVGGVRRTLRMRASF
jgi:hypothetical protein